MEREMITNWRSVSDHFFVSSHARLTHIPMSIRAQIAIRRLSETSRGILLRRFRCQFPYTPRG